MAQENNKAYYKKNFEDIFKQVRKSHQRQDGHILTPIATTFSWVSHSVNFV